MPWRRLLLDTTAAGLCRRARLPAPARAVILGGMGQIEDFADPEIGLPPPSLGRVALILLAVVLVAGFLFAFVWFNGGEEAWYLT